MFALVASFLSLFLLFMVDRPSVVCAAVWKEDASDKDRLRPEDFPILPWSWTPGDLEVLRGIYECGFNLAGFVKPEHVTLANSVGLKSFVSDPRIAGSIGTGPIEDAVIERNVEECVASLRGHEGVFGYYLRDEPNSSLFESLARWAKAVRKADPQKTPYINLFPNYASPEQLGNATYEEYLEAFVETVKPSYISYDHYALMDDGSLRDGYFQNLEAVRKVSLKHGIPFWNIVLSNCHFRYAKPSPDTLRFQVYTTLAYGARGISYFTYFAPMIGNYREAPVDQFMNKTPTWDWLRNINLQIHKLGPTYLQLKSVNVFHHPDVLPGCVGIETSRHIEALNGGQFVVGEFEKADGTPWVMVVNRDLHTSIAFDIRFKIGGQVMLTNAYTGVTEPWSGENVWLAPGQGMLLTTKA